MKISRLQRLWIKISATFQAIYMIWNYGFDKAARRNYKELTRLRKLLEELNKLNERRS